METIIKNIHLLKSVVDEQSIERLEHGALQYRRFARITFKIIYFKDNTLTIEVRQDKSPAENYLKAAEMIRKTKELFSNIVPMSVKINVNAIPYQDPIVEIVTPEYIRHFMTENKIKVKNLADATGVDATNISAWMNGVRDMSQPVKAMFYYYFRDLEKSKALVEKSNALKEVRDIKTRSSVETYFSELNKTIDAYHVRNTDIGDSIIKTAVLSSVSKLLKDNGLDANPDLRELVIKLILNSTSSQTKK